MAYLLDFEADKQSAVIAEGLRLSFGVTTRLPRVATDEVLRYRDWEIPFKVSPHK